jgi:hypothetical protein
MWSIALLASSKKRFETHFKLDNERDFQGTLRYIASSVQHSRALGVLKERKVH